MYDFKMPSLGASMEEGKVVEWRVAAGDAVARGDIICEVETQKGVIDVEIWEDGVVDAILVERGAKVPVGEVLARVDTGEEAEEEANEVDEAANEANEANEEAEEVEQAMLDAPRVSDGRAASARQEAGSRVKASPAARRLAGERGVDLGEVEGHGADGAITLDDVEQALDEREERDHARVSPMARRLADDLGVDLDAVSGSGAHGAVQRRDVEAQAARVGEEERGEAEPGVARDVGPLRAAIAEAMQRSKREIPHYYLEESVEMGRAKAWLKARNAERPPGERLLMAVLVARAVARAAAAFPAVNGVYEDGRFEPAQAVHLGVAVALPGGGVVAPAVHDFDTRGLDELMAAVRDLVHRARRGHLRSSEMSDATLTLTNLGERSVRKVYGVIHPPQVALVGAGEVSERAWASGGMVGARPVIDLTLSGDHRVSDGVVGARFLRRVADLLSAPEELEPAEQSHASKPR